MTAPVLAPAPVPITGTGAGASTGPIHGQHQRYHSSGETRMENTGDQGRGRCAALPGRRCPLLSSCPLPGQTWAGCR